MRGTFSAKCNLSAKCTFGVKCTSKCALKCSLSGKRPFDVMCFLSTKCAFGAKCTFSLKFSAKVFLVFNVKSLPLVQNVFLVPSTLLV